MTVPVSDEVSLEFLRDVFQNPVRKRLSEADRQHIIAAYDGEIRNMDDAFGDLLASLRVRGLYDNTLIIFTSDHGEEFGERGRRGLAFVDAVRRAAACAAGRQDAGLEIRWLGCR